MTDKLKVPESDSAETMAAKALERMIQNTILLKQALELGKTTIDNLTPEEVSMLNTILEMESSDSTNDITQNRTIGFNRMAIRKLLKAVSETENTTS